MHFKGFLYIGGPSGPPNLPAFPRGFGPQTAPPFISLNMSPKGHDTRTTIIVYACSAIILHASTVTILHACTMTIVHVCTMLIVRAGTMIIVHAGIPIIIPACTMNMARKCTMRMPAVSNGALCFWFLINKQRTVFALFQLFMLSSQTTASSIV